MGILVIVDGLKGEVHINPTSEELVSNSKVNKANSKSKKLNGPSLLMNKL